MVTFIDSEGEIRFDFDTAYDWGDIDLSIFDPKGNGTLTGAPEAGMEIVGATARMGDGSPLPAWLNFDETTLRLSGEVPALYFDAPDVRITLTERDTTTGEISSRPLTLELPLEYDVDFRSISGFRAVAEGDDYRLELPEDWSGSFAMRYLAEDQKEAVSANWGLTVFNVVEQREVPVAQDDTLIGREDEALSFTLADLLANDSDGDGDPIRITSFADNLAVNTPTPVYESATQLLDETTRPGLVEAYVTYSATLADGSALPSVPLSTKRLQGWDWDIVERQRVGRVEAEWRDVDTGTRDTVTAGEGDPVHRLRHVHSSEEEARRAAEAKLRRAKRGKLELNARLAGFEPALFAGGNIAVSGVYPGIDGTFLVKRVEHRLAGALTTQVRAQASERGGANATGP